MLGNRWCWRGLAAALIVITSCWHIYYLTRGDAVDLAPDEAHYWMWSQRLDISYYSKGPLVAWLIRASCELLGNNVFAVRLPAILCGSGLLAGLYLLTLRVFHSERLAFFVVAGALTLPMIALSRSLMTIDAPFSCCWCWALVLGYDAICRRSKWAWPALGAVLGLGILAKYTMLLWLGSAGLFLLCSREYRFLFRTQGLWIAVGIAALACIPIVWWNYAHDWVSFRHVHSLAGSGKPTLRWLGPATYLGTQCAILLGFWFVVWLIAMIAHRPSRENDPARGYVWWMSAPTFLLFFAFSFRTDILLNWPAPAYLSGLVLAASWFERQLASGSIWKRGYLAISAAITAAAGVFIIAGTFHVELIRPALIELAGQPTETNRMPLRRFDPTCRLRGWRYLGREVAALEGELRANGEAPVIAASRWYYASEIAFYGGRLDVYSLGPLVADRQSQFDVWRPNPMCDPAEFAGKTFIFVDVRMPQEEIEQAFEHVQTVREVAYQENGQPIARWYLAVCRGYRGSSITKRKY